MLRSIWSSTSITRQYSGGVIKTFLFGKEEKLSDPEELALDLSNSSREKVDSVVKDVLSKRGMNHLEPLENLGIKFNVLKDVEKKFNLKIPSSQLNTLLNGKDIKDFLLFHQAKNKAGAKLFTIDTSSLPSNLSIKQPTLRVGPKKHVVKDPSDPDNYQHYS